ncbi:MAG TPA: cupin domain-containing protein [Gallionella sp.]|nr:cupin domain-containing protein [Gallionella sp.]
MQTTLNRTAKCLLLTCLVLNLPAHAQGAVASTTPSVSRKDLLSAQLTQVRPLARIEAKEVVLEPGLHAPLHLHPCPVVGVVMEGGIVFQIEGKPVQRLGAGDAFYEPANARVVRFDNEGSIPAKFVAFYLPDSGELELTRLLPQ